MKLTLLTITILFALVFFKEAHSTAVDSDVVYCCFGYMEKPIPRIHVVDYFYTSGRCTQRAVVLITRKNQKLCANPETKWVQDHINYLEMKDIKDDA